LQIKKELQSPKKRAAKSKTKKPGEYVGHVTEKELIHVSIYLVQAKNLL
jgi:hypothetical protein